MMTPNRIYLRCYDKYDAVLEYELPTGRSRVLSLREFQQLDTPKAFGSFMQEEDHVAGVYASPEGPTFFLDTQRVVRPFGRVTAAVESLASQKMRFTLNVDGEQLFELVYRERDGIGTNPYDINPEDVDLFALIAQGTDRLQFFLAYTRDWASAP